MENTQQIRSTRKNAFLIAAMVVWCGLMALYAMTSKLSVGLTLAPHASGSVTCQIQPHTLTTDEAPHSTAKGPVSFSIPALCSHFNFVFTPSQEPYRLSALTLFGVPVFNANWLQEKVNSTQPLYRSDFLPQGAPLVLTITPEAKTLDYIRFFDVLLMLFRLYRWGLLGLIGVLSLLMGAFWLFQKYPRLFACWEKIPATAARAGQNKMLFYASTVIVAILSLPAPVCPVDAGLDPSWVWLMNHLALKSAFGTQAVFTYGPLGFVLAPQFPMLNIGVALGFNLVYLGLWCGLLFSLFAHPRIAKLPLWCFVLCAFIPLKSREWDWILLTLSFCATVAFHPALSNRLCILYSVLIAVLGVGVTLMKVSGFLVILVTYFMVVLYLALHDRARMVRSVVTTGIALCASLIAARWLLFPSTETLVTWFRDSLQIASGYNLYMLVNKSWGELLIPFIYIVATVGLLLFRQPLQQSLYRVFFFAPLFFSLMKYALIRQNIDPMLYAGAWVTAILTLFAEPRWKTRCLQTYGILLTLALVLAYAYSLSGAATYANPFGLSLRHVRETINLPRTVERVQRESAANLAPFHFPDPWIKQIGQQPVMVLPIDFSGLAADSLNTVPFYAFQGYSAYTYRLDRKSAEQIADPSHAPAFIICEWFALDNRNLFLESPAFWMTLYRQYRLVDSTSRWLLLQRATPLPVPITGHRKCQITVGQWISTDAFPQPFLTVQWAHTAIGTILATLLRNDMTFLTVEYENGTQMRYRILPDTLQSGVMIHQIPRHFEDFKSLFTGHPDPAMRIKRFKFDSNHGFYYKDTLKLYF